MTRTIIDVHVIQTVPPSNLNRDDSGSPKTAYYGGSRRSRVSSQAWKRAVRTDFRSHLDTSRLGRRTKQIVTELAGRITEQAPELKEQAETLAADAFKAAGIKTAAPKDKDKTVPEAGYLVFLSNTQYDRLAQEAIVAARAGEKLASARAKAIANTEHSVDIALFGRMVADSADLNVDAACQVAHAISTHAVETEYDYYTAVDDRKDDSDETGAGMIGSVEFNSSTLYRYASLNADLLMENLDDVPAAAAAVEAFVQSFVTSMPTGKQNTFANRVLPDLVAVRVRSTQSISLVGAFERAVTSDNGRVAASVQRLAAHADAVESTYGEEPDHAWFCSTTETADGALGERVTFPQLLTQLRTTLDERLGKTG